MEFRDATASPKAQFCPLQRGASLGTPVGFLTSESVFYTWGGIGRVPLLDALTLPFPAFPKLARMAVTAALHRAIPEAHLIIVRILRDGRYFLFPLPRPRS